jgi:small subunit ribosomal protein S17
MQKTITVKVERFFKEPRFGKYIKRYTVCKVHDENEEARIGDRVQIMQTRPLSKTKRYRLVKVIEREEKLRE